MKKTSRNTSRHVRKETIGIVGGGILGLTLAYYLAKGGKKVIVLEKNNELGGLAAGFSIGGASLERYYHHWFKSDTHISDLLKELHIGDKVMWLQSRVGVYSGGKLYDFSTAIDIIKFPLLNFFARLRLGMVTFFLQKIRDYRKFASVSAFAWSSKYFGKQVTDVIWEPLLKGKFGKYYRQISMSWLWARIFDRSSSRSNPLGPEFLGYPQGGFQEVIDRLVHAGKELGVEFVTGADLQSYSFQKGKHYLKFNRQGINQELIFPKLVAALPAPVFIKIFQPAGKTLENLGKIKYLGAICMVLAVEKKFMPYYWLNIADEELPFLAVVEHTNFLPAADYGNLHLLYVAKYLSADDPQLRMNDTELADLYDSSLNKINREYNKSWVKERHIFRTAYAQHIVNLGYNVPEYTTDKKGLYFANFAQIYPHDRGTNYAVAQAQELAKLLLKS